MCSVILVMLLLLLFRFSGTAFAATGDPAIDTFKLANIIIAVANVVLVYVTIRSLWFAGKAHARAERLYVGENYPLIGVTPIGISQNADGTQTVTRFSVVNYSGFKAFNVAIDLKYGENDWILEWRKARDEKIVKGQAQGVVREKPYMSHPISKIREMKPGETKERDEAGEMIEIIGSLNLEDNVCTQGSKGFSVLVRVTWENVNGHVFDEVHQYRLIGTKDVEQSDPGGGRAFTFVPEGVKSQKAGTTR